MKISYGIKKARSYALSYTRITRVGSTLTSPKDRIRMKIASPLASAFRSVVPTVPEFEITCKFYNRRRITRMQAYIKDEPVTMRIYRYTI